MWLGTLAFILNLSSTIIHNPRVMVLIFKLFYLPYIGTFQSHVYKIFQSHIYKILYLLHVYMLIHFSCIGLFGSPWTVVCQAHLSRGFSKQKYWSGLPFPSPGYLPDPGIELVSPALPGLYECYSFALISPSDVTTTVASPQRPPSFLSCSSQY